MVRRLCIFGDRDRRAGAGRGDEHRRGQSLHAQRLEILCRSRHHPCRPGGRGQDRVAGGQAWRAGLHDLLAGAVCTRSAIARRLVDPADFSGGGVRIVHALVPRRRPAARLGRRNPLGIVDGVEQRPEAARDHRSRRGRSSVLVRAWRIVAQYRRRGDRDRDRPFVLAQKDERDCSILILPALADLGCVLPYAVRLPCAVSRTNRLRKVPMPVISISTTSPCLRSGEAPSVPIQITSPGHSVKYFVNSTTNGTTPKIMSLVRKGPVPLPFTFTTVSMVSRSTSVSIQGPIGLNVSAFLARHSPRSAFCQLRSLTSFPIVLPN